MHWLLPVLALMLILACDEETLAPRTTFGGERYFPLQVGQEWLYEMDSIVLVPAIGGIRTDSIRLAVREVLADTVRDLNNLLWYRGERYDRPIDSTEWRFSQTFLLRMDQRRAYRREDNLEFVKMVFPLELNESWDGNAAFDENRVISIGGESVLLYQGWNYRYLDIHQSGDVNGLSFDSLTTVEGVDYDEGLNRRLANEIYAAGVGLVYREIEVFDTECRTCCFNIQEEDENGVLISRTVANRNIEGRDTLIDCVDLPWPEKVEAGLIIRQWLVE